MLMAVMMSPREKWTDERLDDLNVKVDRGFADLKVEIRENFERVDKRMERLEDGFFALNRTLWGGGFVIVAAIIGSSAF
jgi:hypothetical protein